MDTSKQVFEEMFDEAADYIEAFMEQNRKLKSTASEDKIYTTAVLSFCIHKLTEMKLEQINELEFNGLIN